MPFIDSKVPPEGLEHSLFSLRELSFYGRINIEEKHAMGNCFSDRL